jgi:hypothetical protein
MTGHWRLLRRTWILLVAAVVLIGGHVIVTYFWAYTALSGTVVSGLILLMVIKHLGWLAVLLGQLRAHFRRR